MLSCISSTFHFWLFLKKHNMVLQVHISWLSFIKPQFKRFPKDIALPYTAALRVVLDAFSILYNITLWSCYTREPSKHSDIIPQPQSQLTPTLPNPLTKICTIPLSVLSISSHNAYEPRACAFIRNYAHVSWCLYPDKNEVLIRYRVL